MPGQPCQLCPVNRVHETQYNELYEVWTAKCSSFSVAIKVIITMEVEI